MIAVCADCDREVQLPTARGATLVGRCCPHCGGKLIGSTAKVKREPLGGVVKCVACGRRRRAGSRWVDFPRRAFRVLPGRPAPRTLAVGWHAKGSPVCADHNIELEPVPAEGARRLPWGAP